MYCLMIARGAPPTVAMKHECVQSVGSRLFNVGNSCLSRRELRPFIKPTSRLMPKVGLHDSSTCTWSGLVSSSSISASCSWQTSRKISFSRISSGSLSTLRRYFVHHTTWYLQEYTKCLLDFVSRLFAMRKVYTMTASNANALSIPTPKRRGFSRNLGNLFQADFLADVGESRCNRKK